MVSNNSKIGYLLLVILLSGVVYVSMSNSVRIRVDEDKTTFYIKLFDEEGNPYGRWLVSGREYNKLFNGTKGFNRKSSEITIETFVNNVTNSIKIVRTTPYIRGPVMIDTYLFDGNVNSLELFPVSHTVEIINGSICGSRGCIYRYEVRNLVYNGTTRNDVTSPQSFGRRMKVEWDGDNYYSRIYKYTGREEGKLTLKYRVKSDYEKFEIRLFDPYFYSWQDWNDDFEDSDINQTLWSNKTGGCHYGGTSGILDYARITEQSGADGYLEMDTSGSTSGGEHHAAWTGFRTVQDFNDGEDYIINFTYEVDKFRTVTISLTNSTDNFNFKSGENCDTSCGSGFGGFVCQGEAQILFQFSSTSVKQDYSFEINTTTIILRNSTTELNNTAITKEGEWYISFETFIDVIGGTVRSNTSIYNFTVFADVPPAINLTFPINGTFYNTSVEILNYTAFSPRGLDTCFWTNDSGVTNVTVTCGQNVSGMNSSEGSNTWTITTNNSFGGGLSNFSTVTFTIDTIFPTINFRLTVPENNTWINNSIIFSKVEVNETNPNTLTFRLFNTTSQFNVSSFSMADENSNVTFSYLNVPDGNYTFNVTILDKADHSNTTDTRTVFLDSVFPLINYSANSDVTNTSANFTIKDNIFINVTVVELNEKNITFILYNLLGTVNSTTFEDKTRTINFTGLGISMYFWNVTVCDFAHRCNTTNNLQYGLEILNLTIEGLQTNFTVELGTPLVVNATNTDSIICLDIDHPSFGINFTCVNQINVFNVTINWFRKNLFSDGTLSKVFSPVGTEFNTTQLNISAHQYDEVVNLSVNISGENNPEGVTFFKCNTIEFDRSFIGELQQGVIHLSNFSNLTSGTIGSGETNITFNNPGEALRYVYLDDMAKNNLINFTLNVSGFSHGIFFQDNFDNFDLIDKSLTNAQLEIAGAIMPKNSTPLIFTYDDFSDGVMDSTKWLNSTCRFTGGSPFWDCTQELNNKMRLRIASPVGESLTPPVTQTSQAVDLTRYDADHINFSIVANYDVVEDASTASASGSSIVSFGGTEIFSLDIHDVVYPSGQDEKADADLTFSLKKINKTTWQAIIKGTTSWSNHEDGGAKHFVNWDNSTNFTVTDDFLKFTITAFSGSSKLASIDNILDIDDVTRQLWLRENGSAISKSIYDSSGNIGAATLNIVGFAPPGELFQAFLSANNGDDWEGVTLGAEHSFSNTGTNLKWRLDFLNLTGPIYKNGTTFITSVNISTPKGTPTNISFDFGDDNITDFFIGGTFNETNGSIQIELTNANLSGAFTDLRPLFPHLYEVPLRVAVDSVGIVRLFNLNLTYNPNPVYLNITKIQDCVNNLTLHDNFTIDFGSIGGDINVSDVRYDYAGGNFTVEFKAHNTDYSINITRILNFFYSRWDYLFGPSEVDWLVFSPSTPNSVNVTPFGQTNVTPILNLTNLGYGELNTNLSVLINKTEQTNCVNLTMSLTNSKSSGVIVNSSWVELKSNISFLESTDIYMWADYAFNYTSWRLFDPYIFFRQCAMNSTCSEVIV